MKAPSPKIIRVGKIKYINSLPFFHGLAGDQGLSFKFYENYPAKINLAMRQKKVDIALISSLEYLNHQKDYSLLPHWAVGSRDFSGSVQILSREKIEGLNDATIAVTRESLSSAALLKVLLKFKYKFDNRFVVVPSGPSEMLKRYKAALVIGDDALLFQPEEFVFRYDLSELWWNWAEKPFCFSVWAVRQEYARQNPEEVQCFCDQLAQCATKNLNDLETLIKEAMHLTFLDTNFSKVFGYLFNLHYGFDDSMQEGVLLFYRLAHRLGISPKPGKLEFFEAGRRISV